MREQILEQIRKLADRDGVAPGRRKFEHETGITSGSWYGVLWPRWSDAIKEAGLTPNVKNASAKPEALLIAYCEAIRHFRTVPTFAELRIFLRTRGELPSHNTYLKHFGTKEKLVSAIRGFASSNTEFEDVLRYLPTRCVEKPAPENTRAKAKDGYVYLLRSGQHWKIGRTDNIEKRIKSISVSLPEAVELDHVIRTDDPSGIEAYWHKRFSERRLNGEWFQLTREDVRAFRRRKFQ